MQRNKPEAQDFIPELLALMPLSVSDVLICDGPGLSRAYRARNPTARITGMGAVDPGAVDLVVRGPVETMPKSRLGGSFDLIVINETLCRVRDPARLLARLADRLRPGGHLVTSYLNDSHWSRLHARLEGRAVPPDALGPHSVSGLLSGAGLVPRRLRGRPGNAPDATPGWRDMFLRIGTEGGLEPHALQTRLSMTHYVAVAQRPVPGKGVAKPVRFHQIELASLMDVRTRIPAAALAAEPDLQVTRVEKQLRIPDFGPKGGVILVQRPRLSQPQMFVDFVAACQRRGAVVVIEYDDDPSLVARVLRRDDVPEIHVRNLALAHGVQTSTEVLAGQFRQSNPEVMVFGNVAYDLPPQRPRRDGPLRILFGALNRDDTAALAALMAPAIAALPEARFDVIHDHAFFDALPAGNKHFHRLMPYTAYLDLLGECDICLMPLQGLPEELGKSDVKWVEAASRGAVAIASPAVYGQSIRHGENGFIARDPGDWSRLLIALAADPDQRARVAATAHAEVREHRMMAQQVALRRDWYLDLLARRDELHAAAIQRSLPLAAALARD